MNTSNILILTDLLLQYGGKVAEIGTLFRTAQAEGRDVSDAEVAASGVARDVQLAKSVATVG